jgi:tetratricopeptide (TPR) repeat protein
MTTQPDRAKATIPPDDDPKISTTWDKVRIVVTIAAFLAGELLIVFVVARILSRVGYRSERADRFNDAGVELENRGDLDGAIAQYRRALQLKADDANAHDNLGYALVEKGDIQGALAELHRAIDLNPSDPSPWNNLAWLFATSKDSRFKNPAKALEYAQKAVSLSESKNAEFVDTLAEAYFVNGDNDKAIETEERALALIPDNASFKENLAKYQQAGLSKK